MSVRRAAVLVPAGLVVLLLAWWWLATDGGVRPESAQPGPTGDAGSREPDQVGGAVTVLAAASLTEALEDLADRLAEEYSNLEIVYSFGPSSGLAQQAIAGAPADVLVTANTTTMDTAVEGGAVDGGTHIVARNTLVLVTPPDDPGGVDSLADLERDELRVAVCEPQVPCGATAETLLDDAGVDAAPDTLATDVKEVLSLVTLGEVDAALVYQTDAVAADDTVRVVDVDGTSSVVNDYPAAILARAPNPAAARVFVAALTGEHGRSALAAAGFVKP